ncbi:hypothetical protein [Blastococcus montanus]|uniref:hypothetical protein n=1 Tax=Blastococcus montanus TaxID=3144973 RepID=UPI00320B2DC4
MKRSPLPVLLFLAGAAWTAGQAVLPDMGMEWGPRLAAVAGARPAQALSAGLFVVAGALLVTAAVVAARRPLPGRGAGTVRTGLVLLALGGIWLAAGRGAFNLQMYRLTDPAVPAAPAADVLAADIGPGFVPLVLALPALLVAPVVLAAGAWRSGAAGRLPVLALAAWVLGIGGFMASEFSVKAGEVAGLLVASVGLVLVAVAVSRAAVPGAGAPAGTPLAATGHVPAGRV